MFNIELSPELAGKLIGVHALLSKDFFEQYKEHILSTLEEVIRNITPINTD